jgi:CBS domain-containing protein
MPIAEVARLLEQRRLDAVLVRDARQRVVGILSERDVVRGVADGTGDVGGLPAEALMAPGMVMLQADTPVESALQVMDESYVQHLPVAGRDGAVLGIIGLRDLIRHLMVAQQQTVESLSAYMNRRYAR